MAQFPDILREALATLDADGAPRNRPLVLGVAGGVAAGKSTFAEGLRDELAARPRPGRVSIVATDGFLFPNRILAERNLSMRKGFPESYDFEALIGALVALRQGREATIPVYSHVTYDVDPANSTTISGADVVILDGLHLGRVKSDAGGARLVDRLIYLDADDDAIKRWFSERLRPLMIAGRTDPVSFYYGFREMDDAQVDQFIDRVWNGINLPNLRDHIVKDREVADIVVRKGSDHRVVDVVVKTTP